MTQTPHDTAGPGGQGPRVPPAQMRDVSRLRRSTTDRKIAGVAGGLGRHLDIDPTIVRVLLVVLVFFGGAGLLVYGAAWLFVPEDGSDAAPIGTSSETRTVVLVAALVVATLLLGDSWWFGFDSGWPGPVLPVLAVGLVGWLLVRNRSRRGDPQQSPHTPGGAAPPSAGAPPALAPPPQPPPPPRAPRGRSLFGITTAFVLLALGVVAVVEVAGNPLPWAVYPAAALTVIGLAMVTGAFVGRAMGLAFLGVAASVVLATAVWAPELRFGDVDAHPASASGLQDRYAFTAGRLRLDLTDVQDLDRLDGRVLDLSMRAGEVVVELPDGLDVDVFSEAQGGRLDVLGNVTEGRTISNDQATPDTAAPDLRVNLHLGFGNARVSTP